MWRDVALGSGLAGWVRPECLALASTGRVGVAG